MSYIENYIAEASSPEAKNNLRKFHAKYGIEFECLSPLSHAAFRDKLREVIGHDRVSNQAGGYGTRSYSLWNVTSDSSLSGRGHKVELVSPILRVCHREDDAELNKVLQFLHDNQCRSNASCGMHVTMSCDGLSRRNFKPLVFCAFADDLNLVTHFKRHNNRFCVPTSHRIHEHVSGLGQHSSRVDIKDKAARSVLCMTLDTFGNFGKYCSVNTSKFQSSSSVLEYRGIGGNYLNGLTKEVLHGLVRRLSASLVAATHLNETKNENLPVFVTKYYTDLFVATPSSKVSVDIPLCQEHHTMRADMFPTREPPLPSGGMYAFALTARSAPPAEGQRTRKFTFKMTANYLGMQALGCSGRFVSLPFIITQILRNPSQRFRKKAARDVLAAINATNDRGMFISPSSPYTLTSDLSSQVNNELRDLFRAFQDSTAFEKLKSIANG